MQIWNDADQVIARISTREQPGAELPDATLIAEAGTVHHECGLSPRELLEGYREMRYRIEQWLAANEVTAYGEALHDARAALAKHKEV
ncbi:hypothetical protein [Comamonas sp. MYb396]|uniref:hypothetical protein n=1 Tax=Comamonas sp. MYb396 TaxID=2745302 RepID=UPI0030A3BFDC